MTSPASTSGATPLLTINEAATMLNVSPKTVCNLELVRQVLGHADIGTTTRYAHADRDDQRAGMEKVERRK